MIDNSQDFRVRFLCTAFVLAAATIPAAAVGQGTFLTPAVFQTHCSARFSFEASRAKQESDAASFRLLSGRAMNLAKIRKLGKSETDEQLALYARNFETFLREKSATTPELEGAFAQAVEQCKASLENDVN